MSPSSRSLSSPPSEELVIEVAAGEFVFKEGDLGTEMYVLHEGEVEILRELDGELKQIAILEKGDFFGEMSLLEELPRNASARARGTAKLIEINRPTFDRMLRANPEIGVRIMRKLSRRVRHTDELLKAAMTADDGSEQKAPAQPEPRLDPPFLCLLTHPETGLRFEVDVSRPVTVGRVDPVTGIQPDVDLSPVDTDRSSSRRHAKLYRENDQIYLVEEIGTLNGTFVGGSRLQTAVPAEVNHGDPLRFGLVEFGFEVRGTPSR